MLKIELKNVSGYREHKLQNLGIGNKAMPPSAVYVFKKTILQIFAQWRGMGIQREGWSHRRAAL